MNTQTLLLSGGHEKRERRVLLFALAGMVACVTGGFLALDLLEEGSSSTPLSNAGAQANTAAVGQASSQKMAQKSSQTGVGMVVRSGITSRVKENSQKLSSPNNVKGARKDVETVVAVGAAPEFLVQDLRRQLESLERLDSQKQDQISLMTQQCAGDCSAIIAAVEKERAELARDILQTQERLAAVTTDSNEPTHEIVFTSIEP